MKRKVTRPGATANPSAGLPVFDVADRNRVRALPLPAKRLSQRLGLPAATAWTLAELAGFQVEARRWTFLASRRCRARATRPPTSDVTPHKRIKQTFGVHERDGSMRTMTLIGGDAWMMGQLICAATKGVTFLEKPAPRMSHYVWKLRRRFGINIASHEEQHGGAYAGRHVRYVLQRRVEFTSDESEGK
jgi:hypothetical protein